MENKSERKANNQLVPEKITILHQNVDRIGNKIERLNHLLDIHKPDVVVITEHGLKADCIRTVNLVNYDLIIAYCRTNHKKGGVAIYRHNLLGNQIVSANVEHLSSELVCELAAVKLALKEGGEILILGTYRPPDAPLEDALTSLESTLEVLLPANSGICIVGDFNVDSLVESREKSALNELLASFNIHRLPLPATRLTSTSETSIDLVCTSLDNDLLSVEVIHAHLSDHTGQITSLLFPLMKRPTDVSTRRHFNHNNMLAFKENVSHQTWDDILREEDAESAYSKFVTVVTSILDQTCPYKTSRSKPARQKVVSYDREVREMKTAFTEARDKFILTGRPEDKTDLAQKKKIYDLKLRTLRQKENEKVISESSNKNKAIWSIINSEINASQKSKDSTWSLKTANDETINSIHTVSELFNTYFINIAEETLHERNPPKTRAATNVAFTLEERLQTLAPATKHEISKIIRATKVSSSAGVDDISSRLMKFCEKELLTPLTNLINKSLVQGVFPTKMKTSKVYPLHKKGPKYEIQNYRPISLVSTFSKVLERVVLNRLRNHLHQNDIKLSEQHGFIPGRSTITALGEIIEHIIDSLDSGNTIVATSLDLSKAFDCLDHSLMLNKLKLLGIDGTAHTWFSSYLSNRMQIVELRQTVDGTTTAVRSNPLQVKRGVPQGSVLGPVLFALFTADLPSHVNQFSRAVMFADDTILLTSKKTADALEVDNFIALNLAQDYCVNNDLVFNEDKTIQLIMGRLNDQVSGPPNIQTLSSTKHLGVVLDDRLAWNQHVDGLCMKLSSAIFALKRVRSVSTPEATRTSYHALFESHLRYGIIFWGGSSQDNLQRVLVLQKRALRSMVGLQPRESCREAFLGLRILTTASIYILETIAYAIKFSSVRHAAVHNHNTRHNRDFNLPAHKTTIFSKKPSYAGARLYNLLPQHVKEGPPTTLKKRIWHWLAESPIYTLEEFKARARPHSSDAIG